MITNKLRKDYFWCCLLLPFLLMAGGSQEAAAQHLDRGASLKTKQVFIPKGNLLIGGTVSYQHHDFLDYRLLVLENFEADGYHLNISPYAGYFFSDNLAAGLRFAYKRTKIALDEADLNLGESLELNVSDYQVLQHTYYGAATFRNYLPIGKSLRFGLFNEFRLNVGAGQGKVLSGTGVQLEGTYQDIFEIGLQMVPGICVFVTNEVAIEASVGIMGLEYKSVKQVSNQVYEGTYRTGSADFKIDLFSIHIGISAFLPIQKTR